MQLAAVSAVPYIIAFISTLVQSRINKYYAVQQAAEEFNYFQDLSEAEITQLVLFLAREFPDKTQGEWFAAINNMRYYRIGIYQPPITSEEPPPASEEPPKHDTGLYWWIAIGAAALIIIMGERK